MNATLTKHDAPTLERLAEALRPRKRVRPSEWMAKHFEVTRGMGVERPGLFDFGFYPWLETYVDLLYDHPEKCGVVNPKPAQSGQTLATLGVLASRCATRDGRTLYIIGRQESANKIIAERWDVMERIIPPLRVRFQRGREESPRNVLAERNYDGGGIDFVGAKSGPGLSSTTYPDLIIDEFDQAETAFPSGLGGVLKFALGRQTAVLGEKSIWIYSHPTIEGQGIDAVWRDYSDQGRWVFDCPHGGCAKPVHPTHEQIRFMGTLIGNEPDPDTAVLECPWCGKEIADRDRRARVWTEKRGGSGRRWTDMAPEQAARRDYLGFAIDGLCNPHYPLRYFAKLLVTAMRAGEEDLQSTLNVHFGKARSRQKQLISKAVFDDVVQEGKRIGGKIAVPGGDLGVRFVTMGIDVQYAAGPMRGPNDTEKTLLFYVATVAWAANGYGYAIDLSRILGWTQLYQHMRDQAAMVGAGEGNAGEVMGVKSVGIDAGWDTTNVLDHCRETIYSPHEHRRIELVPMKYQSYLKQDNPVIMAKDDKRRHPTRPELGLIDYYWLHRHTWVDRCLQRFASKRMIILGEAPHDFRSHMMANQLRPVETRHGQEKERDEWYKPKEFSDDWMQALAYAEVVAALRCDLDSIHLTAGPSARGEDAPGLVAPMGWSVRR